MLADTLLKQFEHSHLAIRLSCRDVTQMESLFQPLYEGNCINWVLGHILAYRGDVLELLGADPLWTEEHVAAYRRGAPPVTADAEHVHKMDAMLGELDRTQEVLTEKLKGLSDTQLAKPVNDETLGILLAGYQSHEAYHVGQLALLRRIAGKPNVLDPAG